MQQVRGRALFFALFLLAGVALFVYSLISANDPNDPNKGESVLPTGAAVLILASAIVAASAVVALSRVTDDTLKRRARGWSVWYLALWLALLVIFLGFGFMSISPACQRNTDGCTLGWVITEAGALVIVGIPLVILYLGTVIAGLFSAAKAAQRGWFTGLLLSLGVSVLCLCTVVVIQTQSNRTAILLWVSLGLLILGALLFPVSVLIYSFSGR
jgi:hypothetical protein